MWLLDLEGLGNVLGIGSGVRLGCGAKKAQGMARLYTSGWGLTHVLLMLKIGYIFFFMHYRVGAKVVTIIRVAHGLQVQPAIIPAGCSYIGNWQLDNVCPKEHRT